MGMAAIGFINGGADRSLSRDAIRKILGNWNIMSGEQDRLALSDDDVDAFLDCIEGYYRDVEGIKDEITSGRGKAAPSEGQGADTGAGSARPPALPVAFDLWSKLAVS
jgi:hypothetical protein